MFAVLFTPTLVQGIDDKDNGTPGPFNRFEGLRHKEVHELKVEGHLHDVCVPFNHPRHLSAEQRVEYGKLMSERSNQRCGIPFWYIAIEVKEGAQAIEAAHGLRQCRRNRALPCSRQTVKPE